MTAAAVLEVFLERIARLDPGLNAFSVVLAESARAEAAALDKELAATGPRGPLHGVPVAVKDELAVAGLPTTFGGRANTRPEGADGEVVRRLRAAGAVVLGRTRMPELGLWPFTESVAGGLTHNPWDPTRTPGGSSGGSAVAVAAGLVPVALGGDGGGSIRIPAACCGLYGLKPSRGRVSTAPAAHGWFALGTTGPLTRSVADAALVYDAVRGTTDVDRWRAPDPATSFSEAAASEPGRLRIGWSLASPVPGVKPHAEHAAAVRDAASLLADLGHDVGEVDPRYPDVTRAFVPQFFAAAGEYVRSVDHPEHVERRTRAVARLGRWASAAVAERAIGHGERLADVVDERVFSGLDVLLTPTLAGRPPRVGRLEGAGPALAALRAQPMIAHTALWNVTGHPAAAVPWGFAGDGLPTSVQLVGRRGEETTLLALSAQVERERPWASSHPPAS